MKNITLINAGAGSGKTFRLTKELTDAIQNNECHADQVMLTTFTKKAAEEIRVKSRATLLKANLYTEVNALPNAYIGTIHSIGQRLLQKFWHCIGFPKDIRVMEDTDTDFYFSQAIASIPTADELATLTRLNYVFNPMKSRNYDPERWKEDLLSIINKARNNNIFDFSESLVKSDAYAKEVLNSHTAAIDFELVATLIASIQSFGMQLPDKGNTTVKKNLKALRSIDSQQIKYSDLKKVLDAYNALQKKGFGEHDISSLDFYYSSVTLLEDIQTYNRLLFDLAGRSMHAYAAHKKELGVVDYGDMENGFLRLLEIPEVQEELRNTIKLVMVDEFQDSSPLQVSIFIKLSRIVDRSIWVGDPKQSIYGFRGTDPELIDSILKKFEEKDAENLKTDRLENSWRSRPEIVDCVNKVFTPALKSQVREDSIALDPVRTGEHFETPALQYFNMSSYKGEGAKRKLDSTDTSYVKGIVSSTLHILQSSWEVSDRSSVSINSPTTKDLTAKDIAILCKSNDQVAAVAAALKEAGVSALAKSDTLKETAEYALVVSLMQLLATPQNILAKTKLQILSGSKADLGTVIDSRLEFLADLPERPVAPVSTEDTIEDKTAQIAYEKARIAYYDALNAWGSENLLVSGLSSILSEVVSLPFPALLSHLISRLDLYKIVGSWGNTAQRCNNLQALIAHSENYDTRCLNLQLGASIQGFLQYLSDSEGLSESEALNSNAVQVMNYHQSKGLEWPVVLLVDFQKDIHWGFVARNIFGINAVAPDTLHVEDVMQGRHIVSLPWVFGTSNATVSKDFQNHIETLDLYAKAKEKHSDEAKRLLYVGMTRPRDYMAIVGMSGKKKFPWVETVNGHDNWDFASSANVSSGKTSLFGRGDTFEVHAMEVDSVTPLTERDDSFSFEGKKIAPVKDAKPYYVQPSKVQAFTQVSVRLFGDVEARIPLGVSAETQMDVFGNCLHDILYNQLQTASGHASSTTLNQISTLIKNYGLQKVLAASPVYDAISGLHSYIKEVFDPIAWLQEVPVEATIDGQFYKGEIDLLLEVPDGYILIDFKSYPGAIERVLDTASMGSATSNCAGNYAGQLDTYEKLIELSTGKKVVHKLIYYTVLGKMVAVDSLVAVANGLNTLI